ncbi:claudin-1-like [Polyodon spathula]|uniref:claudin-1-like n=1 Tax=Polyodon spathula TaxID=7913 RepID=UPI001B7F33BF|nr:claudin-1-like [Polyodon spathula]XP_041120838.1 claudin-1-like [Polyodon spathula]
MANSGLQLLGFVLAFVGFVGLIASTSMPEWKASSYAGDNIVTALAIYEGLWMSCASQSTGQVQCKWFDSLLQLSASVQTTRALMILGIFLGFFAILIASLGMKCTTCFADDKQKKSRIATTGGAVFITAGLSALVATSWYGHRISQDFYNPFTPTNTKYEFGMALFIGWGAATLCILGGAFLCSSSCSKGGQAGSQKYPKTRSMPSGGKDYV